MLSKQKEWSGKVLDVWIDEYENLKKLQNDFLDIPKEIKLTGAKLNKSKKEALSELKYQEGHLYGQMARQFYYKKTHFEEVDYYQLYELVLD